MALWFPLYVGTVEIGSFSAHRVKGTLCPESFGTYDIQIRAGDDVWGGRILHPYGDGQFALVQRAIGAAGDFTKGVS